MLEMCNYLVYLIVVCVNYFIAFYFIKLYTKPTRGSLYDPSEFFYNPYTIHHNKKQKYVVYLSGRAYTHYTYSILVLEVVFLMNLEVNNLVTLF